MGKTGGSITMRKILNKLIGMKLLKHLKHGFVLISTVIRSLIMNIGNTLIKRLKNHSTIKTIGIAIFFLLTLIAIPLTALLNKMSQADSSSESSTTSTVEPSIEIADPTTPSEGTVSLPANAETPDIITENEKAMEQLFLDYISELDLENSEIAISYYNLVTKESYSYNEDEMFMPASLYKLPLNMYYYEQEAEGAISADTIFAGYTLEECHMLSLQYSDNETSEEMKFSLGTEEEFKEAVQKYGRMPDNVIGEEYFTTKNFSAKYMMNTLKYLNNKKDFFNEAITYLKNANPGQYFEMYLPDSECEVAQKYGWYDGNIHTIGIVYAAQPYLLCVLTEDMAYAESVIGEINRLFYEHTTETAYEETWFTPSDYTVSVNGTESEMRIYTLADVNYVNINDLAYTLSNTESEFNIDRNTESGVVNISTQENYESFGLVPISLEADDKLGTPTEYAYYIDGVDLELMSYMIADNEYVKLQEIAKVLDLGVTIGEEEKSISIDTTVGYENDARFNASP